MRPCDVGPALLPLVRCVGTLVGAFCMCLPLLSNPLAPSLLSLSLLSDSTHIKLSHTQANDCEFDPVRCKITTLHPEFVRITIHESPRLPSSLWSEQLWSAGHAITMDLTCSLLRAPSCFFLLSYEKYSPWHQFHSNRLASIKKSSGGFELNSTKPLREEGSFWILGACTGFIPLLVRDLW